MKKTLTLVSIAIGLVFASVALASGSSSLGGYGGQSGVESQVAGATAPAKGTLPFTGLDLALIVAGGGTLVLAGVALRRGSRGKE